MENKIIMFSFFGSLYDIDRKYQLQFVEQSTMQPKLKVGFIQELFMAVVYLLCMIYVHL